MTQQDPALLRSIRTAVEKNRFEMYFQPVVAPSEHRIVALEALCRFDTAMLEEHRLTVGQAIRLIERERMSESFDLAVIDQTLATVQEFRKKHGLDLPVSINLCADTLASRNFVSQLKRRLLATGMEAGRLKLEIAEAALGAADAYRDVIPRLADAGIACVIDDFISGYADFGMLTTPHISAIKVDPAVTASLTGSEMARRFLRGLLMLVESMNKRLVVMGVDSREQFLFLDAIGCNQYQGSYFGKPMVADRLPKFIREFRQRPMPGIFSDSRRDSAQGRLSNSSNDSHLS